MRDFEKELHRILDMFTGICFTDLSYLEKKIMAKAQVVLGMELVLSPALEVSFKKQ